MSLGSGPLGKKPIGKKMAIKISSMDPPTGCSHVNVVLNDNGIETIYHVHQSEIDEFGGSYDNAKRVMSLAWVRIRQANGEATKQVEFA